MKFIVYLMTLLFVGTAIAQNPTILQGNYITNVFGNSNFVLNPNAQTNVANVTTVTATITRSTTTPLVATSEFTVAIGTANGTATWATRAFDAGMKNNNCEARFTYRGFAATSKVHIKQGANAVASLTLTPATDPRIASINFPCGDLSTATTFQVTDTAILAGTNEIGGIYVGLATNMANVAQAENVVQAQKNSTQTFTSGVADRISFNLETKDTYGEFDTSNGRFTAKRAGDYLIQTTILSDNYVWTAGNYSEIQIVKSNNVICRVFKRVQATVTMNLDMQIMCVISLAVGDFVDTRWEQNRGTTLINVDPSYTYTSISRFPSSSELVVTPERQNTFGGVSYAGSNDFTGTSATVASVTDTTFGARTFYGGASLAGTGCGLTANDTGFCMTNVPPGTYKIAGNFEVGANEAGIDKSYCNYKVRVGGTSLSDTEVINVIPHTNASNQFMSIGTGIIKVNSFQPSLRVWLSYNKEALADFCSVRSSTNVLFSALPSLQISPLDQPSNSALYVQGPVLGAQTGAAIPSGYLGKSEFGGGNGSTTTSPSNVYTISNVTPGVYMVRGYAAAQATGARTATYAGYGCTITSNASLSFNWFDFLNVPQSNFGASGGTFTGFALSNNYANSSSSIMQILNVTSTTTYYVRCAIDANGSGILIVAGAEFIRLN